MRKILGPQQNLSAAQTSRCRRGERAAAVLAAAMLLAACDGMQSTLAPHGPAARSIANVGWAMYIGAALILALVMALALLAVYRAPARRRGISETAFIVGGGVVFPVVTLSVLLFFGVHRADILRAAPADAPVHIEVVGQRWWWKVNYLDAKGTPVATTANEIRLPTGVPVAVSVRTNDVIHSFWVPNLAGKIDLIPGHVNRVRLQADRPGVYRGQCAEYCGAMHALMAFHVIAEPQPDFDAWLARQRQPAAAPSTPLAVRGRESFLKHCAACHAVNGHNAARESGPDLTHFASRRWIAAGTLENTPANLRQWVTHSQRVKPGNAMPDFAHLEPQELDALLAYLEGLE